MQKTFSIETTHRARKIAILGTAFILGLVMFFPVFAHSTSAYTSIGTNNIQNSLVSQLVNPFNPTYVIVNEQALSLSGNSLPSQVTMTLTASYGTGPVYYLASCNTRTIAGFLASCSWNVPLKAFGRYVFTGTVYGANGAMLAQIVIDPFIEPEW
jgi:hypothetical protein